MDLPVKVYETFVHRGSVLIKYHPENIDHPKMFVVMGVSEDSIVGFFFVNSKINSNVIKKSAQLELQYLIKAEEYDFLVHDSYICASSLKRASLSDIKQDFPINEVKHIGDLSSSDVNTLLDKLNASKLYSAYIKETFFS